MRRTPSLTARLAALALVAGATLALTSASAGAASCATPVEKAACDILAAKDRADRAARALEDAETELDNLSVKLATLGEEAAALEAIVNEMQVGVEQLALDRFLGAGGASAGLFSGLDGPTQQVEADALGRIAANTAATSIDDYEAAKADLDKKLAELAQVQADTQQAKETFDAMRAQALEDLEAYKAAYEKAVKDEEIKRALEAQQAERRRIEKEKQEREAADAARLKEIERQKQAQDAANQPQPGGNSGGGGSSGGGDSGGSSSGSGSGGGGGGSDPGGGGTTGGGNSGGGSGNSGGGGGGGGGYIADITCPVDGPNAYGDTWGAPRSGGRSHEGVDMISPTGTHLVAVTSGSVQFKQTRLGGSSVWLTGNDGNRYFYAHLSEFIGESRSVSRGELIGKVGDSGNARGTPHLHFEVHPGGGAAVNPTPSVRAAGC